MQGKIISNISNLYYIEANEKYILVMQEVN